MKYDGHDILRGKYNGHITCMSEEDQDTPWKYRSTELLDSFVQAGKDGLADAVQKGVADLHANGTITFDRDLFPYWGDPMSSIRGLMRGPRIMLGETDGSTTLVPYNQPMDTLAQKGTINIAATGAWNPIYGAIAVIQVAQQQNVFAALPKRPYNKYGFRVVSAAAISSSAGVAEGSQVASAVTPTYVEVDVGQKDVATVTEMSTRLELVSTRDDTITFNGNAQVVFSNLMNAMDTDLLGDADTVAGYNVESLDRLTDSYATYGTYSDVGTATDINWYNTVRSAAATTNYWDSNFYGATTDRPLTLSLIDNLYAACYPYWGSDLGNKIWVTTPGQSVAWSFLEGVKQRFGQETVANTYTQGVQPVIGQAGGFKLSTYNSWPIILDYNVQSDTSGRIMLLDLNHTGMLVGRPIEAIQGNNPLYLQYYLNRLAFYGIMETYGDLPKSCGKIMDLA